jgi:Zn-dependent metalloprotease
MQGRRAGAMAGFVPGQGGRVLHTFVARCCFAGLLVLGAAGSVSAQSLEVEEGGHRQCAPGPGSAGGYGSTGRLPDRRGLHPIPRRTSRRPFRGADDGNKSGGAASVAEIFIEDHRAAFGAVSGATSFTAAGVNTHGGDSFVRMNQSYGGLPVFGAQVVVQVGSDSGVVNVMSDIMRDTRALDSGAVALEPAIGRPEAYSAAVDYFAQQSSTNAPGDYQSIGTATLEIFRPEVVGLAGQTRLVWKLHLVAGGSEFEDNVVLVDALTGEVAFYYSLLEHALDRQIFDANGSITVPATPTRAEGQGATGIPAVDDTYEFLGDTYNFFLDEHGWDSFDGNGGSMVATVNVPFYNACWVVA